MRKIRAILDGLLATVFVALMLQVLSTGTHTVPMPNDGVVASQADEPSLEEINARFEEISASL